MRQDPENTRTACGAVVFYTYRHVILEDRSGQRTAPFPCSADHAMLTITVPGGAAAVSAYEGDWGVTADTAADTMSDVSARYGMFHERIVITSP